MQVSVSVFGLRGLFAAAFLCLLLVGPLSAGQALAQSDPVAFAQKVGETAITDLTDPKLNDSQRVTRMRKLLVNVFDIDAVSRFVLGPYARRTTPEQFETFKKLYLVYVAHNYAGLFKRYNGEKVEFQRAQKLSDGDSTVYGQIYQQGGPPISVELRVHPAGDSFKAVDLKIEGVSMPLTHRKQFGSVINQRGGKVEGLLDALKDATEKFEKEAPSE